MRGGLQHAGGIKGSVAGLQAGLQPKLGWRKPKKGKMRVGKWSCEAGLMSQGCACRIFHPQPHICNGESWPADLQNTLPFSSSSLLIRGYKSTPSEGQVLQMGHVFGESSSSKNAVSLCSLIPGRSAVCFLALFRHS